MVKIIARIIIEVLGAPKSHVEKTLQLVIDKLENEDNIKVINKKSFDTKQQDNGLWSTFAEIEYETDSMQRVIDVCFDYMPSSVEILEPAGMEFDCEIFANMLNDLLARLHRYDMLVKNFNAENTVLRQKLEKLRRDNIELLNKIKK